MKKNTPYRKAFLALDVIILILIAIVCIYPIVYVFFASISNPNEFLKYRGFLYKPLGFTLTAYKGVIENPMVYIGYRNTLIIVVVGVLLNITLSSLGAYFLSKKGMMFKGAILTAIMFTMFFSGGMVPFYLTVKGYGLDNTLWALILPTGINTYNMIIMRTSFSSIPSALYEAAEIDGANDVVILTKIVLPLSKSIIAVMILFYGVYHWNAWFNAMIFMRDKTLYPLQLVLREILIQNDTSAMSQGGAMADTYNIAENIKYAVIIVATVPVLCIYPFIQKYFEKGVMVGAIKG